jgi:hypothetical protein
MPVEIAKGVMPKAIICNQLSREFLAKSMPGALPDVIDACYKLRMSAQ